MEQPLWKGEADKLLRLDWVTRHWWLRAWAKRQPVAHRMILGHMASDQALDGSAGPLKAPPPQYAMSLHCRVELAALRSAAQLVVERHEVLR